MNYEKFYSAPNSVFERLICLYRNADKETNHLLSFPWKAHIETNIL